MSEGWDLFAVVRSCSSLATSIKEKAGDGDEDNDDNLKPESPLPPMAGSNFDRQEHHHHSFSFAAGNDRDRERRYSDMDPYDCNELRDSCKPFLPRWWSSSPPSSSSSSSLALVSNSVLKQEQGNELQDRKAHGGVRVFPSSATTISPSVFVFRGQREEQQQQQQHTQVPGRSRKRKNQQKRTICHVTQENLSSEILFIFSGKSLPGQKTAKRVRSNLYNRNYYRCSSSKGCLARKQVERSNSDPNIFIVTYAGEHTHPRPTHRNSLAGSTRNKPQPIDPTRKPDPGQAGSSDAAKSTENLSPTTPLKENDDVQGTHVDEDVVSQEITMDDEDEIDDIDNDDDDDDDAEDLLIPNLAVRDREDFFSDMQGFAGNFPP
ncbi:PREDICTED: probable WRKY transcription factor 27 [Tarenaya hassleriana]|uniref:probable WRKY transcription factor 27 n=1 Tax=Tarenaya hassleriana TaxID=28532 RepID=UPI00053C38C9|nr:PREDICTED: probable WRKY transcription factor 27 [Tarenaya hassleriana]